MQSVDKLLTNTTNKLALQDSQELTSESSNSAFSQKHILMPKPIHYPKELAFFAKRAQQLEQQITEAKEQQLMMLQMFEKMRKIERGEEKHTKKLQRRNKQDIGKDHQCPHEACHRFYSTQATLQRHIKLKHKIVKNEPPQPFRDLPPWPNLTSGSDCIQEEQSSDLPLVLLDSQPQL